MTQLTGGCLCGNIRYTIDAEPIAVAACHCKNCQRQAGSALSIIAVFPRPSLHLEDTPKVYTDRGTSGQDVYRNFCPNCGSPVLTDTPGAKEEDIIFIKAGTLDDTSILNPTTHYWTKSAQPWFQLPDDAELLVQE
jgi:hypothetical protein